MFGVKKKRIKYKGALPPKGSSDGISVPTKMSPNEVSDPVVKTKYGEIGTEDLDPGYPDTYYTKEVDGGAPSTPYFQKTYDGGEP